MASTASREHQTNEATEAAPMITMMSNESMVVRRPHFLTEAAEAKFLSSRRIYRRLAPLESALWEVLASTRSVRWLRQELGAQVEHAIRALWDAQMIEIVEPLSTGTRRGVLVVEPHADDAALSIGGMLWDRRRECHFTIATVASRSNFTSYYYSEQAYFDTDIVTELRRQESELFAALVAGTHVALGLEDAPLRYRDVKWTRHDFTKHRAAIAAATSRLAMPDETERWRARLHELLCSKSFEEVWIPLGGPHSDHRMTSAICLDLLTHHRELREAGKVLLYQEVPYAARFPTYSRDALRRLQDAGYSVQPVTHSIDRSHAAKFRLISVYGSQFKLSALCGDIDASAQDASGLVERAWQIVAFPHSANFKGLIPRSEQAATEAKHVREWLNRHGDARGLRVVLQVPSGRWSRDLPLLLRMFPLAKVDVLASPEARAEIESDQNERVRCQVIPKGKVWWAATAIRIAGGSGLPTLFLVSESQQRMAARMAKLWVRSDTVIVQSMDRLHEAAEVADR